MQTNSYFDILTFSFSIAAFVPYLWGILKEKVRPTISTWISWIIMDIVLLSSALAEGELLWQLIAYIVGSSVVIFVVVARMDVILEWNRTDSTSIGIVAFAAVLWIFTGNSEFAFLCTLTATVVGILPMIRNISIDPWREPLFPWVLNLFGGLFAVLRVLDSNSITALVPITFFIFQVTTIVYITRRYFQHRI